MTLFNLFISLPTLVTCLGLIWASWDEELVGVVDWMAYKVNTIRIRIASIEVSFDEGVVLFEHTAIPDLTAIPSLPSDPSWPTPSWLDLADDMAFVTRTKVVPALGKAALFVLTFIGPNR